MDEFYDFYAQVEIVSAKLKVTRLVPRAAEEYARKVNSIRSRISRLREELDMLGCALDDEARRSR